MRRNDITAGQDPQIRENDIQQVIGWLHTYWRPIHRRGNHNVILNKGERVHRVVNKKDEECLCQLLQAEPDSLLENYSALVGASCRKQQIEQSVEYSVEENERFRPVNQVDVWVDAISVIKDEESRRRGYQAYWISHKAKGGRVFIQ